MTESNPAVATRARFWRRALAMFIDCCVIVLAVGLVGLALFSPTGGKIRASSVLINSTRCSRPDVNLAEFKVPAGFRITNAAQCTRQILGRVYDRVLVVAEVTKSGNITYTRSMEFAVDTAGHPMRAFYVDYLLLFVLAAYLLLLEWRQGTTIGKGVMRTEVRSLGGGTPTWLQAAKRTAIRFIPAYPAMLMYLAVLMMSPDQLFNWMSYFFAGLAVGVVLLVIMGWNFVAAVRRGELAWHDRWAGTEVIR